jgi:predicted transcriptional regulator
MLEKILSALDLTAEQIRIYMILLNSGTVTAGTLAKKTAMARPTLYDMLRKMRDKGIVVQSMKQGVRSFQAESPKKLDHLLQGRIKELQEQHTRLRIIMPALEAKRAQQVLKPRFQMFDGIEGVKNVVMDILMYPGIETYSFWSIKSAMELLTPEFFRFHNIERIRNKTFVKAIWPHSHTANIRRFPFLGGGKGFYRDIRVAPQEVDSSMGYWVYGDKTAMLSSSRECYGFIIESAEFADMLKKQHAILWKMSKPLLTDPENVKQFLESMMSGSLRRN